MHETLRPVVQWWRGYNTSRGARTSSSNHPNRGVNTYLDERTYAQTAREDELPG